MLTKQYYAYVMNIDEKEVVQKRVELLKNGDNILFFNRDEDTRDIVDYILNIFIQRESTEQKVKEILSEVQTVERGSVGLYEAD